MKKKKKIFQGAISEIKNVRRERQNMMKVIYINNRIWKKIFSHKKFDEFDYTLFLCHSESFV